MSEEPPTPAVPLTLSPLVAPENAILCVRHGLTEWNASFRWQGRADIELTEEGVTQAERAGVTLRESGLQFDALVCSPLLRAHRTAEVLGTALGVSITNTDARLMERDIGDWSGHTTTEIEAKWPGMLDQWRNGGIEQVPGGETEVGMTSRVIDALTEALQTLVKHRNGGRGLLVAHGGVLRTFDNALGGPKQAFNNLEGRWYLWRDGHIIPGDCVTLDAKAVRFGAHSRGTAL
jgi:broad specificity phosphatase PhoE